MNAATDPEHWTWRAGPVAPGPAVLVDLDGVLSDAGRRQHFLHRPDPDWSGFFDACAEDPLIEECKVLLDLLDPALGVVLLTARPIRVHVLTHSWLAGHRIRWDLLLMRPRGVYKEGREFKRAAVGELRRYGFDLRLAMEDDRRNVDMFGELGVPCLYVHSGFYEAGAAVREGPPAS